jgi:tetrahydromethanopterin S-methyltransferase subunit H
MFKFSTHQKVFTLGEIKVGGQPGENPTVLIGSIFYHGHNIVKDEKTGRVDSEAAEHLIKRQEEFSERTGNPSMLDVVGSTKEAIERLIGFVADVSDAPILVDCTSSESKIAGIKYAQEVGLEKRIVYNSLMTKSAPNEFQAIKENGIESAILLAYQQALMTSADRVAAAKALLSKSEQAGVAKPLLDTFVIDVPSLSTACRAMLTLKTELGLPCGCGAHNAVSTWRGLKKRMGIHDVQPCAVATNVAPVVLGADFILYGPIEDCEHVFPAVYAIDTSYRYLYRAKDQWEI